MSGTGTQVLDLIRGYKYGVSISDKASLFFYIINALIVVACLYIVKGKEKTSKSILTKPRLFNWIPIKNVNLNINGVFLTMPLVIDYLIYVKSDWELEEKIFMKKISKEVGIIFDVGSNIGYHTIMLAKENSKSNIISIEASPSIFELLKENCKRNSLENITCFNNAVSDNDDSEINFYKRHSMSTTNKQLLIDWLVPEKEIVKEITRTITIESLLDKINGNEILLLKIDIEGAEVLALNGAKKLLSRKKIQNMMIEYHSYSNRDYILNLLTSLGYKVTFHERPILFENNDLANGHIFAES